MVPEIIRRSPGVGKISRMENSCTSVRSAAGKEGRGRKRITNRKRPRKKWEEGNTFQLRVGEVAPQQRQDALEVTCARELQGRQLYTMHQHTNKILSGVKNILKMKDKRITFS
jgi:hypothetical protein